MKLSSLLRKKIASDPQLRRALHQEIARYERGVSVPLEELPDEFQEMNRNPPDSVIRVREQMEKKGSLDDVGSKLDLADEISSQTAKKGWRTHKSIPFGRDSRDPVILRVEMKGLPHIKVEIGGQVIYFKLNNPRESGPVPGPIKVSGLSNFTETLAKKIIRILETWAVSRSL